MISTAPVATLITAAAGPYGVIVDAVADRPLDARTPCGEWDVRALVRHLLYWSPVLAATGRRAVPVPPAPDESGVEVGDGWPGVLAAARAELVAAWSEPEAWTGTVTMGGPAELPASMIGGMVLGEIVLHGWDLARCAGVDPHWPDEVLDGTLTAVGAMAEQGRGMGVFADAVPVAPDARTLDRVVALAGRDPGWSP